MRLHNIKPRPGAKHRRKRLGCGESSGLGKTSGRGHKGQKSRSGGGPRSTFEGGQMPLYRRLPKRGFNNARFKKYYAVINVGTLEDIFDDGSTVNEEALRDAGLIKGRYAGLKILGEGEVTKKFTIEADRVSSSAKEKIEGAGGQVKAVVAEEPAAEEPAAEEPAAEESAAEESAAEESAAEESEEKEESD